MGNQYTNKSVTYADRLGRMLKNLAKNAPELEYVRGFTGCDGRITARYKECGHELNFSLITIRHRQHSKECPICKQITVKTEREKLEKQKKKEKEKREFETQIKKINYEQMKIKECPVCRTFYFGFDNSLTCSDECNQTRRKRYTNRYKEIRKKKCKTKESREINLVSLFNRDKGICWLCGKPCDMSLKPNDNYYPSIDHVFPVSLGGKDTWGNVKLAHRICNVLKQNKIDMAEVERAIQSYPSVSTRG